MLDFYPSTCPKQYKLPTIDFQKIDSWTPTECEKLFLLELRSKLNVAITRHISYVRDFLKDNELPYKMTKRYRDSLALECCAVYSIFLNATFFQAHVSTGLWQFVNLYLRNSFKNLQAELRRKGFSGLDEFYRKRRKDFGKTPRYQFEIISLKNEMNYRMIMMTDPLANIDFIESIKADTNRGRARANVNYLLEQFEDMEKIISGLVEDRITNSDTSENRPHLFI